MTVTLVVDGAQLTLNLAIAFSDMAGYWLMTISDQYGNLILDSIPLVTGGYPAANLLAQYVYLRIGSCYIINATGDLTMDYPDQNSLGSVFQLVWSDTPTY